MLGKRVSLLALVSRLTVSVVMQASQAAEMKGDLVGKFLYFGYGSNLLSQRIHVQNPTAVRHSIGKLQNYRLDFSTHRSNSWGGATATIVPDSNEHVWGAVWEIDSNDIEHLDNQEGVNTGWYDPVTVTVEAPNGKMLSCRSYVLKDQPEKLLPGEGRPPERQPSRVYREVIIRGARESELPAEYVKKLSDIPHNGYTGGPNTPVRFDFDD